MLDYLKVIENSKAYQMVCQDAKNGRLSHAYLFVSVDENYLKTFQEMVSKLFLNLNETENVEKNNMRIEKRIHPDVKVFGEEKNIDVQTVSTIVEASSVAPFEADKKIFVLTGVQNMNEASQNKILKTIEEPPKNTFFILTATGVSRILQTIISRVKQIELDELKVNDLEEMLVQKGVSYDKAQIFASCANANGTFAEKLATDDGFVDFFNNIVSCFFEINASRDVLKYSNIFTQKSVDKEDFFNICLLVSRDLMMILVGKPDMVVCKNILPKLKVAASMLKIEAVEVLIETCIKAKENLHFNVNSTAVIDNFLFKLAEVKVKCRRS